MRVAGGLALAAVGGALACASTRAAAPASTAAAGPAAVAPAPAPPTPAPPPPAARARVAAFSTGHGERSSERAGRTDDRYPVTGLREILAQRSLEVRTIGGEGGLGEIAAEISLLLIVGPQRPFRSTELAALERFVVRGGRLLVALDPENKIDLHELLAPLGVTFVPELLANDNVFARRSRRDDDRANLVTSTFPPDGPLPTLTRLAGRGAVIFSGAGRLDLAGTSPPPGGSVRPAIKAEAHTFVDRNGNFRSDPGEERGAFDLAAAVTKGSARVFVLADSDGLSDLCVPSLPGNGFLAIDVIDWLAP